MLKKEKFYLSIQDNPHEESMHSEIELIFILEGNVDISVEQKVSHLKAEDILVVNANKHHTLKASEGQLIMRLMIHYKMACEAFQGENVIFWCDSSVSKNEKYNELRIILKRLLKHYAEKENYEKTFGFMADCYLILHHLTANFMVKSTDIQNSEEGDRYEERLNQINQYINTNYDQPISMKDLSEKLFLSNGYLSRFFKKNYGMSFAGYLTNVRVFHAADELLYTDAPITVVAYDCGFTSAAFFNKVFKNAYGVTPSEFRRRAAAQERETEADSDKKALEKRIERIVIKEELGDACGDDSHVREVTGEYSVTEPEEFQNYWGDTINFGDASNLLHSSMREHLMILQRALGFQYVRFWSLFTKGFFIKPDQEEYDFSQIDSILDFVLEQGMKPFIELGMKPKVIHYEVGQTVETERVTYQPFTVPQWDRLMRAFMRHLSMRYGQNVLDGWRMELWFDEDLRSNRNEWENYFDKFEVTYRAVKECNEKIAVGGYGIRMDYGAEQRRDFLARWALRTCQPDYISIMFYAYERGADGKDIYAKRSTDNEVFLHFLDREKKLLSACGMGALPIYICEWALTPSVRNYINDSTFKGAYIIKNIIDLYGRVECMGYGAGSDRQYASYDTPGMLFGGTGLITKEGILKPAAFALEFMNRLFPYYVGKDKNYLITTDCHDNYGIVCHNQQILNYNYYLTSESAIEKDCTWKYFEGRRKLKLKLLLKGLRDGAYRVKVYRINYLNGSVLDIWESMDYDNELSRNDVKYFRRICEPKMSIRKAETVQGSLLIREELQMNEIAFIRIRRII